MCAKCVHAVTVAFLCGAVIAAASASAQVTQQPASDPTQCGQRNPQTGRLVRGALELSPDSDPGEVFKRRTGTADITLYFAVKGCEPSTNPDGVTLALRSRKDTPQIPKAAVGLADDTAPDQRPKIEVDDSNSTLTVTLTASTDGFDPGTYTSQAEIRAPWLVTARSPVQLSRSVPRADIWQIILLGVAGGLGSVIFYAMTTWGARQRSSVKLPRWLLAGTLGAGAVAGAVAALLSWGQQDVWEWDVGNWLPTLGDAFLAGSAGGVAVLLKAVFGALPKDDEEPDDDKPDDDKPDDAQ